MKVHGFEETKGSIANKLVRAKVVALLSWVPSDPWSLRIRIEGFDHLVRMKRVLPSANFVFGAFFGMACMIFIFGMTSYQYDHCRQANQSRQADSSREEPPRTIQSEDQEHEAEITEHAKRNRSVCGVGGAIEFSVGYMDHHEGFFVGLFTFALVLATGLVWQSTNRLWVAGERQFEHIASNANAAKTSAELSRQALIADNRAWLKVRAEIGNQPLLFGGLNGAQFSVAIFAENIGNAPALFVSPHANMYVWRVENGLDPFTRHAAACEAIKLQPAIHDYTLWPGEKFPESIGFGGWNLGIVLSPEEIDAALKASSPHVAIWIGGCIDYTFPADPNGHHQSRFLLELRQTNHMIPDPSQGSIAPNMLRLDKPAFGRGNSAD